MNAIHWCLRLLSLVLLTHLWHTSLAAPHAPKATMPPPTATSIAPEELDTISYLAGASAAAMIKQESGTMGLSPEQLPRVIAGFGRYWRERSNPKQLAYNTGIMIVPEVVDLLRKAEAHAFASDSIHQLSPSHFAQGIEEAQQYATELPAPENELEQWVEGQLLALKNNYSAARAEQLSYALGRVAVTAGYIPAIVHSYGADTLYLAEALAGIAQGLRTLTPADIALYMGLRLGQQGWEAFKTTEVALLGEATTRDSITHLSPEFYLRGFTEVYQDTLRPAASQGQSAALVDHEARFLARLERHYLIRYKRAQRKAKDYWHSLQQDSTLVWLDEHTAYRIESIGQGQKPTPNQRVTAAVTALDTPLRTPASALPADWPKTIRNHRLSTLPQPLRHVLAAVPLGSSVTLYRYDSTTSTIDPEKFSADLPHFVSIYRIDTQHTARATPKRTVSSTAKRKASKRRR